MHFAGSTHPASCMLTRRVDRYAGRGEAKMSAMFELFSRTCVFKLIDVRACLLVDLAQKSGLHVTLADPCRFPRVSLLNFTSALFAILLHISNSHALRTFVLTSLDEASRISASTHIQPRGSAIQPPLVDCDLDYSQPIRRAAPRSTSSRHLSFHLRSAYYRHHASHKAQGR